jgi:singapore isolate B (sub-type 7) whole genome shotgun sequence assembly, scaffold_2
MSVSADTTPVVKVLNVNVLDNPSSMTNPFLFEIVFESSRDLKDGAFRVVGLR